MQALLQRVNYARVSVEGREVGAIEKGILVFIGLEKEDTYEKCCRMFDRILKYRIFYDDNEKMNLNVEQVGGNVLMVSQFTLAANTSSGNRPGFDPAMPPQEAEVLYTRLMEYARVKKPEVKEGIFGADMKIALENDGPVTFLLKI